MMKEAFISLWGCNRNNEISVENCFKSHCSLTREKEEDDRRKEIWSLWFICFYKHYVQYGDISKQTKDHRKLSWQNKKGKKKEAVVSRHVEVTGCTEIVCTLKWTE